METVITINSALEELNALSRSIEEAYIENGGEITEETEQMENAIETINRFLTTEGVDMLGRWLKSNEDRKAALKAEKDYISRQITGVDKSTEFVKSLITRVMNECNIDKVKGVHGYSFTRSTSEKTEVNKEAFARIYPLEPVMRYAKEVLGYPDMAVIKMDVLPSLANAEDKGYEEIISKVINPSVRFTKPRASKE